MEISWEKFMKRIFKHPALARGYSTEIAKFLAARDFLLHHRTDYDTAYREFKWPQLKTFNWARDYFDEMAKDNHNLALWVVNENGEQKCTFEQMRARSNQVANFLESCGFQPFDRIMLMLPNIVELWVWMLAVMKTSGILVPTATALAPKDIDYRMKRAGIKYVVTTTQDANKFDFLSDLPSYRKFLVGQTLPDWKNHSEAENFSTGLSFWQENLATAPLIYYFTSGTTADPKLVIQPNLYPVGHLSTTYALGVQPGTVHLNISTPGWAKHAWSSFFAPWNAEACIFSYGYQRFDANVFLNTLANYPITSLCAPPTVWRILRQKDNLHQYRTQLKEVTSAGEPLNPELFHVFKRAWGINIREIYGLTEVTAILAHPPGQEAKIIPGTMGFPLPGCQVELKQGDRILKGSGKGELVIKKNIGWMERYQDKEQTAKAILNGYFYTGDLASRSVDNCFTFFSRKPDAIAVYFKSSGYQVNPFALESKLLQHPQVLESAVVASPHPIKGNVCKAVIVIKEGVTPDAKLAEDLFAFVASELPAYQQISIIEFREDLPKTISQKIQRGKLTKDEADRMREHSRLQQPRLLFYADHAKHLQKTDSNDNSLRV
jgi:acetyl-CoA synthetase